MAEARWSIQTGRRIGREADYLFYGGIVVAIVLVSLAIATYAVVFSMNGQACFGDPVFYVNGWPVYLPWAFFQHHPDVPQHVFNRGLKWGLAFFFWPMLVLFNFITRDLCHRRSHGR